MHEVFRYIAGLKPEQSLEGDRLAVGLLGSKQEWRGMTSYSHPGVDRL